MKKILNALFVALLAVFTFSSCSDVPAPYEILEPGSGNQDGVQPTGEGTKENPYNVVAAQQNQNGSVAWVEGYIVGTIENVYDEKGEFAGNKANFSGPFEIKTNVMIAASADETNEKNCLPVKIKNGSDLSNALNLQDHPENLKGKLLIQGKLAKGFGKAALVETTAAVFNDKEVGEEQGGQKPDPETPQGSVVFFEETFAQSQGAFTIDNKQLPEGSDHVWAWDSYNEKAYMKASAYVGSAKESESWLISPIVDLTKATKATLTFDHAINKINGDKTHDMTLWVKESKVSEWTQLTIAEYPAGTDWNFVSAGVMDLSAYKGKKMQFAFKYVSSTASCGTWEIKNVKIVGEGEKGEGGGTVEPEPEPQPTEGELIISEYVEGSSNNKYIELYNPTSKAIDLSGYKLRLSANGKVSTDGELIWNTQNDHQLEGTLEAGKTIVYKHKGAALNLSEGVEAIESAAANFNGNDPIALFKGDVLIDLFGVPSDKHDGQTPAKDFAKDKTFRRIASVTKPSKVYNSEEWESAAKDDVSGLGKR